MGGEGDVAMDARTRSQDQGLPSCNRCGRACDRHRPGRDVVGSGNVEKDIEVALDVQQLIDEVGTFLNAAGLIDRIART